MADKYHDVIGRPGLRARVDRYDGNSMSKAARENKVWWTREYIAFIMRAKSGSANAIAEASIALMDALITIGVEPPRDGGEVSMFHGVFVKHNAWCPVGTADKILKTR